MSRKNGVTLPMLIIYIIVLSVIMGAVVLNLGNNNQIEELDKATFQAKIIDYMEQFATMKSYYILKEEFNDEISIIGNDVDIYGRTITDYISSISVEDKEFIYDLDDEGLYLIYDMNYVDTSALLDKFGLRWNETMDKVIWKNN